ncbi:MAG: PIG-L family deacetylase [Nitrospirae bacterium]|nr:MAG: PIG-L family deacetylase [Nitrospirota bacterium]
MTTYREIFDNIKRVMAIAAHPDDIDFECNATIHLLRKMGKDVTYVICTGGEKGGRSSSLSSYDLIKIREYEQREAALKVGVERVVFLRFKDGEIENNKQLRAKIVEQIRRYKPDVIFAPDPANLTFTNPCISHRDHRIVGEAVFDASYPASGNINYFPEQLLDGLECHEAIGLCFFSTHAPNLYVDISSVIEKKIEALQCHKSQLEHIKELKSIVKERFRRMGQMAGCEYAEAFRWLKI